MIHNSSPEDNSSPMIDPPKKKTSTFEQSAPKKSRFESLANELSNNVYYNTGFGDSKYDKDFNFDSQFDQQDPLGSINENRAQLQPWYEKSLSGVGRVLVKATSEIAKMPGVLGGLAAAPFAKEGEGWETAFNNQWIKSINEVNENINTEVLPVYVKKAVSEGNLWDNISSIDFWATEGADGIGYIASMLAPGAIIKSLNVGNKVLGATSKGLSIVNGERKLAGATQALTEMGVTANNIDLVAITLANTLFESSAEAGSAMENFQKEIDLQLENNEISQEKYNELLQQKGKLGRDIFVSNVGILLVPNAIQSKMIWGKGVTKKLIQSSTPSLKTKALSRLKNVGVATASEGFLEEGTQSTVETMFTESAKKGQLTDSFSKDFTLGELADSYLDMLSTTEGQKAIFLGAVLGGGMYTYQGVKNDKVRRKNTNDALSLAEEKVNSFNNIYDNDPYIRDENNEIVLDENNKPIYDPVKISKITKALNLTEEKNKLFEQAIQEGNSQLIEELRNNAVNQLIIPFINKGELGIDALKQHLEKSNVEKTEENNELVSEIIQKAEYLQKQYEAYKDFNNSLIDLKNENATEEDYVEFNNMLADLYLNYKLEEYDERKKLISLNTQKNQIVEELKINDQILSENSVENNKPRKDPRIDQIDKEIKNSKKKLKEIDSIINDFIWNSEDINKMFNNRVILNKNIREADNENNEEALQSEINEVTNANTVEEIDKVQTVNPLVKEKKEEKKEVLQDEKNQLQENQRKSAIEEELGEAIPDEIADNFTNLDFGEQSEKESTKIPEEKYTEITAVEGSEFTDELTPTEGVNNSLEELKTISNGEIDSDKGVKVVSTDFSTGEPLDFIKEQFPNYIEYEREPVNKKNRQVGFEINQNPGDVSPEVYKSLELFNNKDFSNMSFLFNYLPINVKFTDTVLAPIETMRRNGEIDKSTELLRIEIINELSKGKDIETLRGSVQDQYKGLLKIDSSTAENDILELDSVKSNLKFVRDNLYVVDSFGQLQNIMNPKQTVMFKNPFTENSNRVKENAKGEIYLMIPQANGKDFPLKLNIKKVSVNEADVLFEMYKEILKNTASFSTTLSNINEELKSQILKDLSEELNVIGGVINDIKLEEIIDLMIYGKTSNPKSQIRINNNILYYGNQIADITNIEASKDKIIQFLTNEKRHQIKISPKEKTDNLKTNIQSNSADYLKYLLNNRILSTNAIVKEPTFQGYTNIYLNTALAESKEFKKISNISEKLNKLHTIDSLAEVYKLLSKEQQSYYKKDFSKRKEELKTKNPEGSDLGVNIPNENFESLDFTPEKMSKEILDNVRNIEENFVSLSEIEGTVENKEVEKNQEEVYEVPSNPRERKQDIQRLVILNNKIKNGTKLSQKEMTDFEKFKKAYPKEYIKKCK